MQTWHCIKQTNFTVKLGSIIYHINPWVCCRVMAYNYRCGLWHCLPLPVLHSLGCNPHFAWECQGVTFPYASNNRMIVEMKWWLAEGSYSLIWDLSHFSHSQILPLSKMRERGIHVEQQSAMGPACLKLKTCLGDSRFLGSFYLFTFTWCGRNHIYMKQ